MSAEAMTGADGNRAVALDRAAIARALTTVEQGGEAAVALLGRLRRTGRSVRIGITGAPGSGKSTLTMQLVRVLRSSGTVGVIAIDPSSPFTGGALLGDRVRMNDVASDEGVFIRSMASRGALGGLSIAAADGADVLDAAGFDFVLIETVGVGQSELDIARVADTTIVVVTPESGDEVQTAKAGLMEIADVFVLNKDDRPDGNALWNALRRMIDARTRDVTGERSPPIVRTAPAAGQGSAPLEGWSPPIVRTVATSGQGIGALVDALGDHRCFLSQADRLAARRRARDRQRLVSLVAALLKRRLQADPWPRRIDAELDAISEGRRSLHESAAALAHLYSESAP
jgi:LAO/AO transport system kinase